MNNVNDLGNWLISIALTALSVAVLFFALGCLLYGVYHFFKRETVDDAFAVRRWPVVLVGLGTTTLLCGIQAGKITSLFTLVLPCLGFLLGVWITSNCLRGWRTAIWMIPKIGVMAVLVAVLGGIAFYLATSKTPANFDSLQVSVEEKSRLVKLIRRRGPLGGDIKRLHLTERDVNVLLALACEHLSADVKANAELRDGAVRLVLSAGVPLGASQRRYVNLQGVYHLEIRDGSVAFWTDQLSIGRLHIPKLLADALRDNVLAAVQGNERANAIISAIDRLYFTDQQLAAVYHADRLHYELMRAFRFHLDKSQKVVDAAVVLATAAYARRLLDKAPEILEGEKPFEAFLRTAFTFARERSQEGKDPVAENKAAILALAIVLGHRGVEAFVGDVTNNRMKIKIRWYQGKTAVRGRLDWARHFFVSAGLALTFNSGFSDGAGLFKEEIDSAKGGSGFSFADLLADRAGVRFAVAATHNREAAERLQELLANPFPIDDIFPPAADLPEGLQDASFQQRFGGIDGAGYQQMLMKIERRLDSCAALTYK